MNAKDFPKEVTKKNIDQLREKAERIKQKSLQARYGFSALFLIIISTAAFMLSSIFFVIRLALNHYLDFIFWFPPEWQAAIFLALLFIIAAAITFPTVGLITLSILWLQRKYFGYPKHEERIFANCFIIANYLMNNERMKAKKEVGHLLANLTTFVRDLFNRKRKIYAPEFDLLRCGKTEVCRMIMFSKEETPELLMNFGLAFVRNDNPEAFSNLTQLVNKVAEYGEPKGRFSGFLSRIEQYRHSLALILGIIVFIVSVLFTIFGYPLR